MRHFINLVESLSTVLDWRWLDENPVDSCAIFSSGDRKVNVYIYLRDRNSGIPDRFDVTFEVDRGENLTGGGDAYRIFATVIAITEDFIANHRVTSIGFSAVSSEPSRVSLYRRLASQLATKSGMTVSEREGDYFGHESVIFTLDR